MSPEQAREMGQRLCEYYTERVPHAERIYRRRHAGTVDRIASQVAFRALRLLTDAARALDDLDADRAVWDIILDPGCGPEPQRATVVKLQRGLDSPATAQRTLNDSGDYLPVFHDDEPPPKAA